MHLGKQALCSVGYFTSLIGTNHTTRTLDGMKTSAYLDQLVVLELLSEFRQVFRDLHEHHLRFFSIDLKYLFIMIVFITSQFLLSLDYLRRWDEFSQIKRTI